MTIIQVKGPHFIHLFEGPLPLQDHSSNDLLFPQTFRANSQLRELYLVPMLRNFFLTVTDSSKPQSFQLILSIAREWNLLKWRHYEQKLDDVLMTTNILAYFDHYQ